MRWTRLVGLLLGGLVLSAPVRAKEQWFAILGKATRSPGPEQTFAPDAIPVGMRCLGVRTDVSDHLNPASAIRFWGEVSFDKGVTWTDPETGNPLHGIRTTRPGGVGLDQHGKKKQYAKISMPLPDATNTARMIRGGYQVLGAPATFDLAVQFRDDSC